jgi:hypothetical protein
MLFAGDLKPRMLIKAFTDLAQQAPVTEGGRISLDIPTVDGNAPLSLVLEIERAGPTISLRIASNYRFYVGGFRISAGNNVFTPVFFSIVPKPPQMDCLGFVPQTLLATHKLTVPADATLAIEYNDD